MSGYGSDKPAPTWSPNVYQQSIDPQWIDYNGHLRDGYYALIASASIDALMDDLGLDDHYRRDTHCTLYTLEMHVRFLKEVKGDATLILDRYPAELDAKRLRLLIAMRSSSRSDDIAAVVDVMLMHVHQGESVRASAFPAMTNERLNAWRAQPIPDNVLALGSRPLSLSRKT